MKAQSQSIPQLDQTDTIQSEVLAVVGPLKVYGHANGELSIGGNETLSDLLHSKALKLSSLLQMTWGEPAEAFDLLNEPVRHHVMWLASDLADELVLLSSLVPFIRHDELMRQHKKGHHEPHP